MKLFAIGVGGSGAKCLEATIHLHTIGLLDREGSPPTELGVLFVEPDRQSALLQRARTALIRTQSLRKALDGVTQRFCHGGGLTDYGVWNPVESVAGQGSLTMAQIYTKQTLAHTSPALGGLMDCLFTQEEQKLDLREGFRGRPPIGSALMSAIELEDHQTWVRFLGDVRQAAKGGQDVYIHMFGSVFGGTGASGVPTVGRLLRNWLKEEQIQSTALNASLLLPYFHFKSHGAEDTGLHAEASNFHLNTSAALQYLSQDGASPFDRVYLLGSDAKVAYDFSIGGTSQANGAHLVELLATLGPQHSFGKTEQDAAAYTLSRDSQGSVNWNDLPDSASTQSALSRGARLAVVWRNNIALDLEAADGQSLRSFSVGAPWATRFYNSSGEEVKTLGSRNDKDVRFAANQWAETLLTWLRQLCSSTGGALEQKLLDPAKLAVQQRHLASLDGLVYDSDRATTGKRATDVEDLKIKLDDRRARGFNPQGTGGLLDTLWELCNQP